MEKMLSAYRISLFVDHTVFVLAFKQDKHKSSEEFEILPDPTTFERLNSSAESEFETWPDLNRDCKVSSALVPLKNTYLLISAEIGSTS